jgi:hypothetical protein
MVRGNRDKQSTGNSLTGERSHRGDGTEWAEWPGNENTSRGDGETDETGDEKNGKKDKETETETRIQNLVDAEDNLYV